MQELVQIMINYVKLVVSLNLQINFLLFLCSTPRYLEMIDTTNPPVKPDLSIIDINQTGVFYTSHLALHYFRASGESGKPAPSVEDSGDKCLIIVSSFSGYFDLLSGWQYCISKNAARCLMKNMRRVVSKQGIRVNLITPT
jgi:NAD(P)-dependent dehydrogenase (short-subunit alcohol dehydrogenase family)